jgi:NAD-dependent dihydropyrimidine dehydrogenase PreA subunit
LTKNKIMVREVVKIDEELCNGCGDCVPNCHEGALQIIDGKVRLISDLLCDGLGACIGHCPVGAITIEKREAEAYDENKVMQMMVTKGKNTVIAHLKHLKEHDEKEFLRQGIDFLEMNKTSIDFNIEEVMNELNDKPVFQPVHAAHQGLGGCPGSREVSFTKANNMSSGIAVNTPSELRQWPVQLHLINPMAGYFQKADVLIAADCTAFSMGNFHRDYLKDKALVIACPKLDSNKQIYVEKIKALISNSLANTLTVLIMEVPCCGGLLAMVQEAVAGSGRKIPVKLAIVSIQGEVIQEDWV